MLVQFLNVFYCLGCLISMYSFSVYKYIYISIIWAVVMSGKRGGGRKASGPPEHSYQNSLQLNMSLIFTVTCDHVLYDWTCDGDCVNYLPWNPPLSHNTLRWTHAGFRQTMSEPNFTSSRTIITSAVTDSLEPRRLISLSCCRCRGGEWKLWILIFLYHLNQSLVWTHGRSALWSGDGGTLTMAGLNVYRRDPDSLTAAEDELALQLL